MKHKIVLALLIIMLILGTQASTIVKANPDQQTHYENLGDNTQPLEIIGHIGG